MNTIANRKVGNGAELTDADLNTVSGGMWMEDPLTPSNTIRAGAIAGGMATAPVWAAPAAAAGAIFLVGVGIGHVAREHGYL